MVNENVKRCSTYLVIREMQIKITRYHFTHTRMAKIKKMSSNNVGEDMGKQKPDKFLVGM
jgi:hypothetical protein